jgi:hypothetical protein
MLVSITYASPSAFNSTREGAELSLAANRGVRFHGKVVRHGFTLRMALRALGQVIWSQDTWHRASDYFPFVLDPVITVHPDRIWLEAFSRDMSAYAALIVEPTVFELAGETAFGTTNIDFTAWLWGALDEMRTSRTTWFRVGAAGAELTTSGAGGRFEQKVEIPDAWVRGFLQVQGAMALPGTRLGARPVDLLAAIRFLKFNKARISPRALRYELEPGQFARLVIEPWEHVVPLVDAVHGYTEKRLIRTWGRRRLRLLEPLLPFAEGVDVYLKGRALPSFYAVKLPGMTFILGLSAHADAGFGSSGSFDLNTPVPPDASAEGVLALLATAFHLSTSEVAETAGLRLEQASQALTALCHQGRVMYDLEARRWRHRELFTPPVDVSMLYPPDLRREEAQRLIEAGITNLAARVEEDLRVRRYVNPGTGEKVERQVTFLQWRIEGDCGGEHPTIVVNAEERIIFGQCGCAFFKDHMMSRGPCRHMLALFQLSRDKRSPAPA